MKNPEEARVANAKVKDPERLEEVTALTDRIDNVRGNITGLGVAATMMTILNTPALFLHSGRLCADPYDRRDQCRGELVTTVVNSGILLVNLLMLVLLLYLRFRSEPRALADLKSFRDRIVEEDQDGTRSLGLSRTSRLETDEEIAAFKKQVDTYQLSAPSRRDRIFKPGEAPYDAEQQSSGQLRQRR